MKRKYPNCIFSVLQGFQNSSRIIFFFAFFSPFILQAQVSGTVFQDLNGNGIKDNSATFNEIFEPNIIVTAYNSANTILASYKTNASGVFTIPVSGAAYNSVLGSNTGFIAAATQVRLEFTGLANSEFSAAVGTGNSSSVQFVTAPAASVVFGVNYPDDYFGTTNPSVIFPSYRNGVNTGNEDPALATVLYNSTGLNSNYLNGNGVAGTGPIPKVPATVAEIGATWGLAYNSKMKRSYHAAFLKRHVAVADGLGYIYVIDQTRSYNALLGKFNLQGVSPANGGAALDFGAVCRSAACAGNPGNTGITADYTLSSDKFSPNIDLDAYAKVGKVGYGDIDMQPNTNILWAVNVFENSLLSMDISGAASTVPAVNRYTLAGMTNYPTSATGLLHPWALAFHHGYGYLGVTDDASISTVNTDLKCYLLRFDPNNMAAGFTVMLNFNPNTNGSSTPEYRFQYWLATYAEPPVVISGSGNTHYHQPMFSDIEFDTDESLILSIMDREGHQLQSENYKPISGTSTLNIVLTYGTMLKACWNGTIYNIEGTGGCGSATEFFADAVGDCDREGGLGGTLLIPGMGQVISTMKNPFPGSGCGTDYYNSQGLMTFSTSTGAPSNWYTKNIGDALPFMGKAAGIGDIEAIGQLQPIEIGNRVWADTDSDGIQDANEAGIGNVSMALYADFDNNGIADIDAGGAFSVNNPAATATGVACGGTAWTSPANAATVNTTAATVNLASGGTSQCLQVASLGFALPATATVTGVTVNIIRKASVLATALDNTVQLLVGGVATGTNKAKAGLTYPTTLAGTVYGNSLDLWGTTLTVAQVNAANFGVSFRAGRTGGGASTVSVDAIEVNVSYTLPSGATFVATTTTATSGTIGTWYFNATNVADGDPSTPGNQPGLAPNKKYIVRVLAANIPSGTLLTTANVGGAGQPDVRDSDASLVSGNAEIAYTTGIAGQNDHTLDMGFAPLPPTINLTVTSTGSCSCSSANGYLNVTGLSNLPGATFNTAGSYDNVPLPGYGTVDISYAYTGAGTGIVPDFRNLDISQGIALTTDYTSLGYPSAGGVPGLRNKIAAGQTGTLTYNFDQPVKEVNLAVFDVDWDDAVTVMAWDAYGNLITDFSGWTYQTGDLTVPATASIASWNPATHVISSTLNSDGERNFSLLKPNVYISRASFAFTGTTDPNANSPHSQYTIFSNLQAARICQAAATISVAFTNPPAGQSITVTNGGYTQTIASGASSPQTVTLPYPPDGTGPHTITASFTGGVPATATTSYTNISCYGSLGNYVWTDTNGDGIQNEPVANGLNGVIVQLWSPGADNAIGGSGANADVLLQTTTTANNGSGNPGYYNFVITATGNYFLKFPTTNGTNVLSKNGWSLNDATDMNAEAVNGYSNVLNINVTGTGLSKDNPTYDAGYAPCLSLYNVVVGSCQDVGGESKVQVSVTVAAPSAHQFGFAFVEVTAGGITQYHSSDQTPLTATFLLPANGTSGNITAVVNPSSICGVNASLPYTLPVACTTNPCGAAGTIGGTVFKDMNTNGVRDQGEYGVGTGIAGITVTLFSNVGQVAQTTTNASGQYTFSGLTTAVTYRVEFSNYPATWLPSFVGAGAGSSVQFITVPGCANFGLAYPSDYCQDNPFVLAPTYANGNPTASSSAGTTGNLGFLQKWRFAAKDSAVISGANFGASNYKTTYADSVFRGYQIGATWGLAYNKNNKIAYASTVLRRHVGYGPLGSGGIYKMDFSTPTPTINNWLNLDALGISTGNATINTGSRALPSSPGSPNNDFAAYDGVGKYSFGDLEISDDGTKLFVVNLLNRNLHIINISNASASPTLADVTSVAIPTGSCNATNNNFRPWALKYYRGKIYVGGVCSGETLPIAGGFPNMTATIYSLDPANIGAGFTQVFTYPVNYRYWTNWHSTFVDEYHSSPMLTDIEFDIDGSMILGMVDRKGLQLGNDNYPPTGTSLIDGMSGGDLLRVHNNNGTFVMENNGVSGPYIGTGGQTLQEPASYTKGFFQQQGPIQRYNNGQLPIHSVSAQGGLAILPAKGKIISSFLSPINFYAGGVGTFDTRNGALNSGFEFFHSIGGGTGKMGKAAGVGDLELMCNAAPIEIGNYVWIDTDADGIQDPSEAGISGVEVRLYSANFTLVGKTTTSIRGEYYFNMYNVDTTGVNASTGAANTGYTGLNYNRPYYIVLGKSGQFNSTTAQLTASGNNYGLTTANTGQGTNSDWNDSDAALANAVNATINGFPYIAFTSGTAGATNHTYDFGFKTVGSVGNYVWKDTNGNGIQDEPAANGINGVTIQLWSAGADGLMGGGDDVIMATTATANNASANPGYYNFTIETSGNYYIQFPTATATYILSPQTTTAATDNNSDAATSTGFSPVFTINIAGVGTAKDNPTLDAGYTCPNGCVPISVIKK